MLFDALIPSLEEVGARFERGDYFVPEMLIAARAMQGALDILRPLLAETGVEQVGTFLMGTVKGDVHDIGKNLCNIMLEGAGFTVVDLGVNVAAREVRRRDRASIEPDIVGMSAFLTTTMPMFKANINALEKAGLRDKVIVMVGGAPVTQEYADAVGADGYSADASSAVKKAKALDPGARGRRRRAHEPARDRRARGQGPDLGLPHVRAVRAARHRADLPDDLPEDAAQRAVRRRAPGRPLRGQARDALRVAQGLRPRASTCRCGATHIHQPAPAGRQPARRARRRGATWSPAATGRPRRAGGAGGDVAP